MISLNLRHLSGVTMFERSEHPLACCLAHVSADEMCKPTAVILPSALLLWFSQASYFCLSSAARSPKIYVADVPRKYNLGLLEALGTDQEFRNTNFVENILASPYGPRIDAADFDGLRQSSYIGLDIAFQLNVLRSPLRTRDAAQADVVFVQFSVHKLAAMKQY